MKLIALTLLAVLTAILGACGGGPSPRNINGLWLSQLNNPDGTLAFAFPVTLTQGSGSGLNVTGLGLDGSSPCFSMPTSQTATFSATGSSNGFQTGPFTMTVSTLFPEGLNNVLTLNGNRNGDGSISGMWTLTGLPGCTGTNGTFTMNPPPLV
jgi:hypothetical protein